MVRKAKEGLFFLLAAKFQSWVTVQNSIAKIFLKPTNVQNDTLTVIKIPDDIFGENMWPYCQV